MHQVSYTMGMSLDGYIVGPDGGFDWSEPSPDVFGHHLQQLRDTSVHLMGRRLYETMLYWETAEQEQDLDDAEVEWARLWKALPKVVFSRTLTAVEGTNTTLATGGVAEEIVRLKAEPGEGDIAIGGAGLAAAIAAEGLIDVYQPLLYPVLVGGGVPYFPHDVRRHDLDLAWSQTFAGKILATRYVVRR